ncbi:MAG: hypothetical protein ACRDNS_32655 [Trebonia sp.]
MSAHRVRRRGELAAMAELVAVLAISVVRLERRVAELERERPVIVRVGGARTA